MCKSIWRRQLVKSDETPETDFAFLTKSCALKNRGFVCLGRSLCSCSVIPHGYGETRLRSVLVFTSSYCGWFDLFPVVNDASWNPELHGRFLLHCHESKLQRCESDVLGGANGTTHRQARVQGRTESLDRLECGQECKQAVNADWSPTVFFVPAYLLMGIGHGFSAFIGMLLVIVLVNSSAVGLAYMVSCTVHRVAIAPIIGVGVILPFLLFGGLFIDSDSCPEYFAWVQYISPIEYGFEALMKIFWGEISIIPCDDKFETCVATMGAQVLLNYGMQTRSVPSNILILIAISFSFRSVASAALWINLR